MAIIILLSITALFILFGIMLSLGKWSFLISGYNMMSAKEKAQYDEKALCTFMGKVMFSIAFCILLTSLSEYFNLIALRYLALSAIFLIGIFTIFYLNSSKRFKKK